MWHFGSVKYYNNVTRNLDVFVCCSEISVSVIVEHEWHIGIIRAFCLTWENLLSFSVPKGTEKIVELRFASGDQYPSWHYVALNPNKAHACDGLAIPVFQMCSDSICKLLSIIF